MSLVGYLHKLGRDFVLREQIQRGVWRAKRYLYGYRVRGVRRRVRGPIAMSRVLIVMEAGIGNAIEATPLVQAARMLWPHGRITVLTVPGDLFENWCVPDELVSYPAELAGRTFDHTFVAWASRVPQAAGCGFGRVHHVSCLLSRWLLRPERDYNVDMLRPLGYRGAAPPLYVGTKAPAMGFREESHRVCIVPVGKRVDWAPDGRWPYYGELIEEILARWPESEICVLGAGDDDFPAGMPVHANVVDLRRQLTLREAAWLFQRTALAIGNDCGLMHVADAVQTPSITLFGPTCEMKNGPRHKGVGVGLDLPCRPCQYAPHRSPCEGKRARCLEGLSVERVMSVVSDQLSIIGRDEPSVGQLRP